MFMSFSIRDFCPVVVAVVFALGLLPSVALAGAPGDEAIAEPGPPAKIKNLAPYDMSWWSVDGGGGSSAGGVFGLTGAIGQPDVGAAAGCGVVLEGGLWSGTRASETPLFCNGFETGNTAAWSVTTP